MRFFSVHMWKLHSAVPTNKGTHFQITMTLRKNYALWSSCSVSVLPTASGLERGSKSANRLNHAERSLDVPAFSVKWVEKDKCLRHAAKNINPSLCPRKKDCMWLISKLMNGNKPQILWMYPINTGFSWICLFESVSFMSFHLFYSFGLVLPFAAGLEGFWLAPDECCVAWAAGCVMLPAQSETETQILD